MPACEPKLEKSLLGSLRKVRETIGWTWHVDEVSVAAEDVSEQ